MTGIAVYVISKGRPGNVPAMRQHVGTDVTWVVPEAEVAPYRLAGAKHILPDDGGLTAGRNVALRDAWAQGLACVQVSDDLTGVITFSLSADSSLASGWRVHRRRASFSDALAAMTQAAAGSPYALVGCRPNTSPFGLVPGNRVQNRHFIVGDLILVKPCTVLFDEGLRLKEDYDYTAQHVQQLGGVVRLNDLAPAFKHRDNAGGAVAARQAGAGLEAATCMTLLARWPQYLKPNPRRANELVFSVARPQAKSAGGPR